MVLRPGCMRWKTDTTMIREPRRRSQRRSRACARPRFCWSCSAMKSARDPAAVGRGGGAGARPGGRPAYVRSLAEQAESALEEFYQMTVAHDYVLKGGIDYARKMLINAFGPEHARKMLDRLVKALGSETASFRCAAKSRSRSSSPNSSTRASPDHRADPVAPESFASRRPAVLAACRSCAPTWRCAWPISIRSRPRSSPRSPHHRHEVESPGRVEPRILRRRARGLGDVQPPRLRHQQGNPGDASSSSIPRWWKPSGT